MATCDRDEFDLKFVVPWKPHLDFGWLRIFEYPDLTKGPRRNATMKNRGQPKSTQRLQSLLGLQGTPLGRVHHLVSERTEEHWNRPYERIPKRVNFSGYGIGYGPTAFKTSSTLLKENSLTCKEKEGDKSAARTDPMSCRCSTKLQCTESSLLYHVDGTSIIICALHIHPSKHIRISQLFRKKKEGRT
jgi:hypothetical protein